MLGVFLRFSHQNIHFKYMVEGVLTPGKFWSTHLLYTYITLTCIVNYYRLVFLKKYVLVSISRFPYSVFSVTVGIQGGRCVTYWVLVCFSTLQWILQAPWHTQKAGNKNYWKLLRKYLIYHALFSICFKLY